MRNIRIPVRKLLNIFERLQFDLVPENKLRLKQLVMLNNPPYILSLRYFTIELISHLCPCMIGGLR